MFPSTRFLPFLRLVEIGYYDTGIDYDGAAFRLLFNIEKEEEFREEVRNTIKLMEIHQDLTALLDHYQPMLEEGKTLKTIDLPFTVRLAKDYKRSIESTLEERLRKLEMD